MDTSRGAVVLELAGVVVVLAGISMISRRAPRLIEADRTAEPTGSALPSWG